MPLLRSRTVRSFDRLVLLLVALTAGCGTELGNGAASDRPSVVFLSLDTLSARHMSLYGYGRDTTPCIDRFAEDAVVFERCWANAPWTTPSYMSQFTGLHAASFNKPGELEEGESAWFLSPSHETLAEVLRGAGYHTAAFIDNPNVGAHLGFDQGFELFDDSAAERSIEDPEGGMLHIAPLALAWLDGLEPDERFFLFVQALDVHGPYLPHDDWKGTYRNAPATIVDRTVPIALGHDAILGAIPKYIADPIQAEGETELSVRALIDAYDEGIRGLDAALGSFFDALDERGLLDDAFVVISADHGESMVAHESYFDHQLLHGEELHVPLIVRPPGGLAGGRRVGQGVQLIDLYPTLIELAGASVSGVHGRSLARVWTGSTDDRRKEPPLVARGDFLDSRSIVVGNWKLIETNPTPNSGGVVGFLTTPRARRWIGARFPEFEGKVFGTAQLPASTLDGVDVTALFEEAKGELLGPFHALYDLNADPGESIDVSAQHPERVAELLARLDSESRRAEEARILDGASDANGETSPEMIEELRKLGYAEGE